MEKLTKTTERIPKPDKGIYEKALERLADQARPNGSLGDLEDLSARLAGITGRIDVKLDNKMIVTCAGDHGVVQEGVSLFPQEVTLQMVENFVNGGASINVLARHVGATVKVADLGVNHDFKRDLPIFHKKIRKGTCNMAIGPAMSREEAVRSVEAGIEIVNELFDEAHVDILGTGDMGIANTTASSAIIAAMSGIAVEKVTGRGAGLDDDGLKNKIEVIKRALAVNDPDPYDGIDVLSKVGGFEIGGLAGLVIGAASKGIPVVCDGLISTAGAMIACELAPAAREYLFASHRSQEIGHRYMHDWLQLAPILDLKLRLGEGTGAALAIGLLEAATRILADIKTFDEVNIKNAQIAG